MLTNHFPQPVESGKLRIVLDSGISYKFMRSNSKHSILARLSTVSPEVAKRWGKILSIKAGKYIGRRIARWRIARAEMQRRKALEDAHNSIVDAYRKAEQLNLEHSMAVLRVSLYLLTISRDLSAIKVDVLTAKDWWLRKLLARNVALLIHELDMNKVTGAKFRAAINYFSPPKELKNSLKVSLDDLETVHARLKEQFSDIRNFTIAHRDADAMKQFRLIRNIDEIEVVRKASEFFIAAQPVIKNLTELTLEAGGMHHILNQYVGKKKFKKLK